MRRGAAVIAAVVALVAACADSDARPKRKGKRAMTYDEAVALLGKPERWCDGAAALGKLGDKRAIGPLYGVVALSGEGIPDRACVREALEQLGVRDQAALLVASAEAAERRTGIAMMKEFPGEANLAVLARLAVKDPDRALRLPAARALRIHKITPAWDAAMTTLLDAPDDDVRELAAGSLERRFGAPVLAALKARLNVEKDDAVRAALTAAIALHEEHAKKP